eukprot:SAG11_NODE_971_length_6351_cov_4.531190_7_plen_173_part_00
MVDLCGEHGSGAMGASVVGNRPSYHPATRSLYSRHDFELLRTISSCRMLRPFIVRSHRRSRSVRIEQEFLLTVLFIGDEKPIFFSNNGGNGKRRRRRRRRRRRKTGKNRSLSWKTWKVWKISVLLHFTLRGLLILVEPLLSCGLFWGPLCCGFPCGFLVGSLQSRPWLKPQL